MGRGKLCPYRHNQGEKMVVCKHCFLHQYDVTRMPECYFYSKFGDCNNKECPFLHVTPAFKTRDCPWYDQGFCKDDEAPVVGRPLCKQCHVRKIMCVNYLVGVCPKGPHCQFGGAGAGVSRSFYSTCSLGSSLSLAPHYAQPSLSHDLLQVPIVGKAHATTQTPFNLCNLCFSPVSP
uniref:Cleavage and polyadenylation specificity factor subunit 4 n=1 Tax=Canis lupus dingo TaxID=286419 RepID=A0A8C0LBD9_CANLU